MRLGLDASSFCPKWHVVGLIESRIQPLQKKKKKVQFCALSMTFFMGCSFSPLSHIIMLKRWAPHWSHIASRVLKLYLLPHLWPNQVPGLHCTTGCDYIGHEVCHWDANFLYYIYGELQACSDACFPSYPLYKKFARLEVTFKLNTKALSWLLDLEIELLHDIKNQIGANVQRNKSSS